MASQEYFSVTDQKQLNAPVVTPLFKEYKNGQLKTVAIHAKRARGKMANFIVKNRIDAPQMLKTFNEDRYAYHGSFCRPTVGIRPLNSLPPLAFSKKKARACQSTPARGYVPTALLS